MVTGHLVGDVVGEHVPDEFLAQLLLLLKRATGALSCCDLRHGLLLVELLALAIEEEPAALAPF